MLRSAHTVFTYIFLSAIKIIRLNVDEHICEAFLSIIMIVTRRECKKCILMPIIILLRANIFAM